MKDQEFANPKRAIGECCHCVDLDEPCEQCDAYAEERGHAPGTRVIVASAGDSVKHVRYSEEEMRERLRYRVTAEAIWDALEAKQ